MELRLAKHCNNLEIMEKFYVNVVGLQKLGEFKNHDGYNGIFLGLPDINWHLEFTTSSDASSHTFDEDDAIVFYVHSNSELDSIERKLQLWKIPTLQSRNPYWNNRTSIIFSDPEGYKIIFTIKPIELSSQDELTLLAKSKHIRTWSELLQYINYLPYGRNSNRLDFSLVLKENKGTCSSKHSFLKKIAELNFVPGVKLILGMYKMNPVNTPKIAEILLNSGLDYLPEAHCYLKLYDKRIDLTTDTSDIEKIKDDILEEIEIDAEQVQHFKVEYHKSYLEKWITAHEIDFDFAYIWKLREQCIKQLED